MARAQTIPWKDDGLTVVDPVKMTMHAEIISRSPLIHWDRATMQEKFVATFKSVKDDSDFFLKNTEGSWDHKAVHMVVDLAPFERNRALGNISDPDHKKMAVRAITNMAAFFAEYAVPCKNDCEPALCITYPPAHVRVYFCDWCALTLCGIKLHDFTSCIIVREHVLESCQ
jgi:hypothetical protein